MEPAVVEEVAMVEVVEGMGSTAAAMGEDEAAAKLQAIQRGRAVRKGPTPPAEVQRRWLETEVQAVEVEAAATQDAFAALDLDGDGKLSAEELGANPEVGSQWDPMGSSCFLSDLTQPRRPIPCRLPSYPSLSPSPITPHCDSLPPTHTLSHAHTQPRAHTDTHNCP